MSTNKKMVKLAKIILLLLFAGVFTLSIISNSVYSFVHKRHIRMIIFAIIVFIISAIIEMFSSKNMGDNKKFWFVGIFLIPIVLYFFSNKNLTLSSIAQNIDLNSQTESTGIEPIRKNPSDLKMVNEAIIMDDDSFGMWISEIYLSVEDYVGKKIEITGEFWLGEKMEAKEFAIGRLMMVCCAADMQAVGFLCKADSRPNLSDGDWIKVKGVLKSRPVMYDDIEIHDPFIEVSSVEQVEKPENTFAYPF